MEREMKVVLHGNADVTELRQEEQSIFLSALYMRMLDLVGKQRTEQETNCLSAVGA